MNKIIRTLTVVAAFAAQTLPLSAMAGESPNLLVNGSFENPPNATSFYEFHDSGEEGLAWQALSLDGQIEIGSVRGEFGAYARSSYGATYAFDGYQFAELSANAVGALFQKVPTVPGKTYRWSWSRKARFGTETSAFWTLSPEKFEEAKELYLQYLRGEQPLSVIRPAVQALTNEHFVCTHADVELSGDTVTWTRYEGTFTVPDDQPETYVVLVEWNKNPEDAQGCLVDAVTFSEDPLPVRGIVEVYNVKGGTATATVDGDSVTLEGEGFAYDFYPTNKTLKVTAVPEPGYTFQGAFVVGYTNVSDGVSYQTESLSESALSAYSVHAGLQALALAYGKDSTVSFLPRGGTYACVEKTLAKTAGSNCVPGVPTRTGYLFQGWMERTTLKVLKADAPIIWKDDQLIAVAESDEKIAVPAADGLQLLACWKMNKDWLPDGGIEFVDGFGASSFYALPRNGSMPASANPKFEHREGFVEYKLVGWLLRPLQMSLSTNITAAYVGVPNAVNGGTDGVVTLMDAEGSCLSITNRPSMRFEAIWEPKHTNEWAVIDTSVEGGAASYFDALSEALAALKVGDTLLARPPAEGFGLGEGLKPDTNDVIRADCAFTVTTDDVTVDLNGRVLNTTVDGKDGDYLMSVVGAKGVTVRNGYLFGVKESFDHQSYGPQACRGIKVDNLAEARVEDAVLYYSPYAEAVLADRQSELVFVRCHLDGDGDGAEGVVCARKGSVLALEDCKGLWNEGDFWNNPILDGSLDNVTGEQFLLDGSALVLDNTVVSNSYDNTESGKVLPYIVTTRGESTITLENGAGIREGARGTTQGAIHVENGSCAVGNGRTDGLQVADGYVIGRLVAEEGATLVAGAAAYSDDPTRFLPEGGTAVVGDRGWSVVVSSGSQLRDKLEYAVGASGIENIHVNKFVPFPDDFPYVQDIAGNASMWLKMTEGGLAQKLYLERHKRSCEVGVDYIVTNSVPDALFPTNTVMAHVWRGHGEELTNAYNLITTDVAKTIFDPEVVNLLTNFAPLVKSVTRGAGSATIPYVDADGDQQLGKAVILGCEKDDWTAYDVLVKELKKIGQGCEVTPDPASRRYVVTNSTGTIFGSRTPSVAFGSLGYVVISSSEEVWSAIMQAAFDFGKEGKKPFYETRRAVAEAYDAELKRIDPDYASCNRNFKTEGFERFGYAYLSAMYQPALAKMLEGIGVNPAIAGTNRVFRYTATLCSEECSSANDRMRIDLHGNEATLRAIGFSLRFSNMLLVNAGIVDKDYMTFDEAWRYDREKLAQISAWLADAREQLGLNGANYYYTELEDRTKATVSIGYTGGRGFQQLFCAGKAGRMAENPCEACLPTNTVAAFCFQPDAAAWAELNERLLAQFGEDREILRQVCAAFKSHPNSFGKSAAIGVVLGSEVKTYGPRGGLSSALGAVSSVRIEDENLWYSIRILLEQLGCTTRVGETFPSVTVCEFTNSTFSVAYDREYKIVEFATRREFGHAASVARRNKEARLVSSSNKVFNDRMGIKPGELQPVHNTLFYFAPESDTVLVETLKEYLDSVGLGALTYLARHDDLSGTWACGYGKADAEKGEFLADSYISKEIWDKCHGLFEATAETLGQIAAEAYPYDASKARAFKAGDMTFHVSRADNWDDVNGRLYPYDGDNLRVRVQTVDSAGNAFDKVVSCRLGTDGHFAVDADGVTCSGYLSSEGVFGKAFNLASGSFICREAPEIEPELSVLPSAEEIAEQLQQVKDAIGIESATVGAAKSDDRTGPFGEPTVVRETTVVPEPSGILARLLAQKGTGTREPMAYYMPSNTAFGASFTFSEGALSNAVAALRYFQPELMEYFEKLLLGFGVDESELVASVNDGLALGIAKYEDGVEPYFTVRLKRGQAQNWVAMTNRLYNTTGVTVTDFASAVHTPGAWEAIAFTRVDPVSGREVKRCYSRIFEGDNREPAFIITQGDDIRSGIMAAVRRAGLVGEARLVDDATFKACYTEDSSLRGFVYLAPILDKYWFYKRLTVTEDGELVIRRRTSAAVAPIEATVARFAVNFFEALRGETSKISFENDPEADKVAEEATKRVTDAIHKMRTTLGVTGLDFYDAGQDADGRYGNSELAIWTRGDGCEFLRRFAADAPASEHLVETYIPDTAAALVTMDSEAGLMAQNIGETLASIGELVGEKQPEVKAAITNFLASDNWKIVTEVLRETGTHKAFAILQDLEHPFVKDVGDGNYASVCAGYSAVNVMGPTDGALPFLLLKQALSADESWTFYSTNGVDCLVHNGQFEGRDLSQFLRPTFMFDTRSNVLIFATSVAAAKAAGLAGRKGTDRLIDSATFADVTGFDPGEPMPEHNTLYYLAPQNDDTLGCTLRRILSPYLPESYAMLLDRPSLKGYWGGAYGVRVGDAFRLYIHAGIKGHTAFLAASEALLKTVAEGIRVRQPYDWTEPKVFRAAEGVRLIEPTDEKGIYSASVIHGTGDLGFAELLDAGSDNTGAKSGSSILCKYCIFVSIQSGQTGSGGGRTPFHMEFLDEEADPNDYTGGIAMELAADEVLYQTGEPQPLAGEPPSQAGEPPSQADEPPSSAGGPQFQTVVAVFHAGEKLEQELRLWPTDAKVTKVTGLPKGLSIKKTSEGYFLMGTPTKVGEDCTATMTATCAGHQTTSKEFHIRISNYASDYAELDAGYDLTAGIDDTLMLTNVVGWTASGVPTGMKFDKTTGALSGTPAKPGEYVVVFTTKIGKTTEKVSTVITVGQGEGVRIATGFNEKTFEFAEDGETREIYAGVKIDWPVEVKGLEDVETTLSAKGLPSGLKLVKTTDKVTKEVSYSIQGIATKASAVDKKTGLVKPSMVVLSGTNKYKWSGEETFDLVVKALPGWAIGTFNGYNGSVQGVPDGSVKVAVSSVGKVSISVNGVAPATGRAQSDSFVFTGFDSYDPQNKCFAFAIENAKWKTGFVSRFSGAIGMDKDLAEVGLEVGRYIASSDFGEKLFVQAASNYDWAKEIFPTGKNQLTLELSDSINPGLEGLTLTFAQGGKVTVAGSVTDPETGKKVSVSASPALVAELNADDKIGDGLITVSVGFVVKTKTPFYAYVPFWMQIGEDGTVVGVYKTDPRKVGVCTWCWGTDMTEVLDYMDQADVKNMSLALMSWLKPSDGSQYESPFGFPETEEMFEAIGNKIASDEVRVNSTMLSFPHEDWSTYESISNTVGIMYTADPSDPTGEKAWTVHSNLVEQAAILTQKLGVEHLTCFVGFLMKPIVVGGVDVNADGAIGLARLHAAHQYCDKYGVRLLLESGHYSGAETMAILAAYEQKYGAGKLPLAINFDAANHLAYGNDTPRVAYDGMKSRIGQVHVKDALEGTTGGGFAVDVMWGTGDVSGKYDLLGYLREQGYDGDLLVECEAGENRFAYIAAALKALR